MTDTTIKQLYYAAINNSTWEQYGLQLLLNVSCQVTAF